MNVNELKKKILSQTFLFLVSLWALIFLPAWSLDYWQGWLYWVVFSFEILFITFYFLQKDPQLMERRLRAGSGAEKEQSQKTIQRFTGITFLLLFLFPGLDHQFGWSYVDPALVWIADFFVAQGFFLVFLTFRVNSYTSSIIEVASGQMVVSTGPYALVRHPMYAGTALLLVATPVALGSWWGLLFVIPALGGMIWRLLDEERYLLQHLAGYSDYCRKVRFRLIPYVY